VNLAAWALVLVAAALCLAIWQWRAERRRREMAERLARRWATEVQKIAEDKDRIGLRYDLLADSSADLLLITDRNLRLTYANAAAESLFGAWEPEVSLIRYTQSQALEAQAQQALASADLESERLLSLRDRPYRSRVRVRGDVVGLALTDAAEVQRLTRARQDMVANLSHELRTPLTSIGLLAQTLVARSGDRASHPGGDSASHPGGDSASYPGGDSASHPGGDSASHPGGDSASHPGGDSASYPGGDSASYPGGDSASHPGGDSASYPGGDSASYPGGDSASYPGGDLGGEAAATGELAHKILAEVDTLNQMSQEMLDLAAIESGRQVIRLVAVPLQEIVAVPLERLREQAARQGVNLRAEIPTGLSVLADRDQAARAILNVLHNAVKFTPKGGSVSLTAAADPDGEHVILTVSDEGPGIAPAELGRIFERFFRGDQARGTPGTGLGLAITRHILQAHGGDVWAENRAPPASGAVVRLRFLTG